MGFLAVAWTAGACGPGVDEGPIFKSVYDVSDPPWDSDTRAESTDRDTSHLSEQPLDTSAPEGGAPPTDPAQGSDTQSQVDAGGHVSIVGPAPPGCEPSAFGAAQLLSITEILAGGRFVGMGTDCVLAAAPEEETTHVQVIFLDGETSMLVIDAMDGRFPGEPVDVACHFDAKEEKRTALVLMRDATGSTIYEGTRGGGWRTLFEGPELMGLNRFFYGGAIRYNRFCGFGQGIYCTDVEGDRLTWTPERSGEDGDGAHYSDLAVTECDGDLCAVAVGLGGVIDIKRGGVWRRVQEETVAHLFSVSSLQDGAYTAAGQAGVLLHGSLLEDTPPVRVSVPFDEDIVTLKWYKPNAFKGVTSQGIVFEGAVAGDQLIMCEDRVELNQEIRRGFFLYCGADISFFALSDQTVFGEYECTMVIAIS